MQFPAKQTILSTEYISQYTERGSTMTATNDDHDGHNHDDHDGEIYPTMLNELNCTFDVSFSRFHCCVRHGHGLWPLWFGPQKNLHLEHRTPQIVII